MTLEFHQSIFDLLGVVPKASVSRSAAITSREALLDCRFPKSIVEWFSIENVETIFCENTNEDNLTDHKEIGEKSDVEQGYLCVATENQGVVAWYAELDGSEDPPVFDNNDEWEEDLSTIDWQFCSYSFSNFVFDMISSGHFGGWYSGTRISAVDKFPDSSIIDLLGQNYQEGPITEYADCRVRRFFNTHGIISISSNTPELNSENLANWSVETDTIENLHEFASSLWRIQELRQRFEADSCAPESRNLGSQVLEKLKRELG